MQIEKLVLYSRWGDIRTLDFKIGALNIITGKSKTGKSAIGRIIEYTLGSDEFGVFVGAIRNCVSWYGLVIRVGDDKLFLARPDPGQQNSTSQMYIEVGFGDALPKLESLEANTSTTAVRDRLARLCGISPNLHEPPPGQTRRPLEATLSHAIPYCFQGQNLVANPEQLFHKQNQEWVPQAIRDTFPYFLGAVGEDRLEKVIKLRQLRQQIRMIESDLAELEALRKNTSARMRSLLDEAVTAGIIEKWTDEDAFDQLNVISTIALSPISNLTEDPSIGLRATRSELITRYGQIQDAIRATKRYRDEQGGFSSEAREQLLRLKCVNILPEPDAQMCPICEQPLPDNTTKAEDLLRSLREIESQIGSAVHDQPRLLEHISKLESEAGSVSLEIGALDQRISVLAEQSRLLREQQSREVSRGRVQGRISLFLESLNEVKSVDVGANQNRLVALKEEASGLAAELDEEALRERFQTLMVSLNRQIGDMADRFALEHKGIGVRFDLRLLTIVIEQQGKPVPLNQIGSGENWVGYHLAFFLALHSWFVSMQRPVPAFIFIDQPTQAYFPPDSDSDGNLGDLDKDDDREAVRRMFSIMYEVIQALSPSFQIIVTDHADIAEDWFRSCVIERWRGGNALIPQSWLDKANV